MSLPFDESYKRKEKKGFIQNGAPIEVSKLNVLLDSVGLLSVDFQYS